VFIFLFYTFSFNANMLRVNPTQIRLSKKDLDWHIPRHEERQGLRAIVPPNDASKATRKSPRKQAQGKSPRRSPPPRRPLSSRGAAFRSGPDVEIFSDDPVPRGSRAFWDRVLAEAGTPTRVQTASLATATVVEPSNEFLNSTHSSKGSIESVSNDEYNESGDVQSPLSNPAGGSSSFGTPDASESSNSARNRKVQTDKAEQLPPPRAITQSSSSRNRLSFFQFRRKTRPQPDGSLDSVGSFQVDQNLTGSMTVDGPSDRRVGRYRDSSLSARRGSDSDLDDGLYGNRRDRRTISEAYPNLEDEAPGQDVETLARTQPDRTALPPPRTIGHSHNYSGSMPRSSLYISEAVASSSPERRPRTPTDENPSGMERQGLLSQPPRRPKMYRRRSVTYSFAESDVDVPQMDGPSAVQAVNESVPSLTVSHPPRHPETSTGRLSYRQQTPTSPGGMSNDYIRSSPPIMQSPRSPYSNNSVSSPQETIEIRSYRSLSSIHSSHSRIPSSTSQINSSPSYTNSVQRTIPIRNLSPYAAPFVPRNSPRNLSPQLALPPPFSSTSRTVSYNNSYPPSSPASPHTPPQQLHPPPTLSPSNILQPSRRIPIYNDNIDPTTQPQTPAGLPRHGVPDMATQRAGALTAPPGRGLGRFTRGALAEWQAFATPTRRSSVWGRQRRGGGDQENVGALTEEERRERREGGMGEG